jgi:hypothetical protein
MFVMERIPGRYLALECDPVCLCLAFLFGTDIARWAGSYDA